MSKSENVVFIPGMLCDKRLWNKLLEENELPGNHIFVEPIQFNTKEDILENVIEVGGDSFHLVGFSMGGILSCDLLVKCPEKIKSVTLIGMNGHSFSTQEKQYFEMMIKSSNVGTFKAMTFKRVKSYLSKESYEIKTSVMKMANTYSKEEFQSQMRTVMNRDNHMELIKDCKVPALIVGSSEDSFNKIERVKDLTSLFIDSTFLEIKDCGHMIPMEDPKQLSRALMDHLKSNMI